MTLGQKLALSTSIAICLAMVATAQSPQTPPKPATPANSANPKAPEQFDKVHESVFTKGQSRGSQQTHRRSGALPGRARQQRPDSSQELHRRAHFRPDEARQHSSRGPSHPMRNSSVAPTSMRQARCRRADEVRRLLPARIPSKRDKLIDKLVGSEEFAEQWAWHLGRHACAQQGHRPTTSG